MRPAVHQRLTAVPGLCPQVDNERIFPMAVSVFMWLKKQIWPIPSWTSSEGLEKCKLLH
jgi:hypothetical protein